MSRLGLVRRPKTMTWVVFGLAVMVVLAYLLNYIGEARTRHERAPSCRWHIASNPNNVPHDQRYSAKFCYLARGMILLRMYFDGNKLVAERTYSYPDIPEFYWKPNGLGYANDDPVYGGFIDIPPTFIDRLRAKLP